MPWSVITGRHLRDVVGTQLELGHITRLENLPGRIDSTLANQRVPDQDLQQRIVQAEAGLGKPFKYTDELAAAEDRYNEITAAMAADRDEPVLVPADNTTEGPSPADRATRVAWVLAEARAKSPTRDHPRVTGSGPNDSQNTHQGGKSTANRTTCVFAGR